MHVAFPYVDILRYGGNIPGQPEGTASVRSLSKHFTQFVTSHYTTSKCEKTAFTCGMVPLP